MRPLASTRLAWVPRNMVMVCNVPPSLPAMVDTCPHLHSGISWGIMGFYGTSKFYYKKWHRDAVLLCRYGQGCLFVNKVNNWYILHYHHGSGAGGQNGWKRMAVKRPGPVRQPCVSERHEGSGCSIQMPFSGGACSNEGARWSVSRVLSCLIHGEAGRSFLWDVFCNTPHATNPNDRAGPLSHGCGPSFLFGLAPGGVYHDRRCCQPRGALLPHRFTLVRIFPP